MVGESSRQCANSETPSLPVEAFSLEDCKRMTNNFANERLIGHGGFGKVYKGYLPNGEEVAVKKFLKVSGVTDRQFVNEARLLIHPNIVQILGCCSEKSEERLLCFKYMPRGNLRKYLSDESSGLSWDKRYKIIEGICCGLHYLHNCKEPIIHMDLKPENILLNDNMEPIIADFGQSRFITDEETHITKGHIGTNGYMAPEYIEEGAISKKSDIFSLGVIIIEIVTGHRNYIGLESSEFIDHVTTNWISRMKGCASLEINCEQIRRCIEVGLFCVYRNSERRPCVSAIMVMLHQPESKERHMQLIKVALSKVDRKIQLYKKSCETLDKQEQCLKEYKEKLETKLKPFEEGQMAMPTSSDVKRDRLRMRAEEIISNQITKRMRQDGQTINGLDPIQENFRIPIHLHYDQQKIEKELFKLTRPKD